VSSLAFHPGNPAVLVSGGGDKKLRVWKRGDTGWRVEQVLEGHKDWVRDRALAFAPDGKRLASVSYRNDNRVIWWDTETWTKEDEWQAPGEVFSVFSVTFLRDSRYLGLGNGNGTVYILRLP
jgi:WD40 repeat protein